MEVGSDCWFSNRELHLDLNNLSELVQRVYLPTHTTYLS